LGEKVVWQMLQQYPEALVFPAPRHMTLGARARNFAGPPVVVLLYRKR
jgi:hypothetical protein